LAAAPPSLAVAAADELPSLDEPWNKYGCPEAQVTRRQRAFAAREHLADHPRPSMESVDFASFTKAHLRLWLRSEGLPSSGAKDQMVARLVQRRESLRKAAAAPQQASAAAPTPPAPATAQTQGTQQH